MSLMKPGRSAITIFLSGLLCAAALAEQPRQVIKRSPIQEGLLWLARHQGESGMWNGAEWQQSCQGSPCAGIGSWKDNDFANTGTALLAFLGAGNSHRFGAFKKNVANVLKGLHETQNPDGSFGRKEESFKWKFGNFLTGAAIIESYGMSGKSKLLKPMAENAVNYALSVRNEDGGWSSTSDKESDVMGTCLAGFVLYSGKICGIPVPESVFEKVIGWVDEQTDLNSGKVRFSKNKAEGTYDSTGKPRNRVPLETAAGMLAKYFAGEKADSPAMLKSAKILAAHAPVLGRDRAMPDAMYCFLGAQAAWQVGGEVWETWSKALTETIIPLQIKSEDCTNGSFEPKDRFGKLGGRPLTTALYVLTLECARRYKRK